MARHHKLNDAQINEIRAMLSRRVTQKVIASKFGVSQVTISKIANGHRIPTGVYIEMGTSIFNLQTGEITEGSGGGTWSFTKA